MGKVSLSLVVLVIIQALSSSCRVVKFGSVKVYVDLASRATAAWSGNSWPSGISLTNK